MRRYFSNPISSPTSRQACHGVPRITTAGTAAQPAHPSVLVARDSLVLREIILLFIVSSKYRVYVKEPQSSPSQTSAGHVSREGFSVLGDECHLFPCPALLRRVRRDGTKGFRSFRLTPTSGRRYRVGRRAFGIWSSLPVVPRDCHSQARCKNHWGKRLLICIMYPAS